ncbi:MAG: hypothetical protein JRJ85_19570 [Deltaproteobacteria bacterium]|nr:hypothetical protein [Deltaproteobacteria bacterium]
MKILRIEYKRKNFFGELSGKPIILLKEYGSIRKVWWKVLQKNMGLKCLFFTKSMTMLKMLLKGKSRLRNGEEHGN